MLLRDSEDKRDIALVHAHAVSPDTMSIEFHVSSKYFLQIMSYLLSSAKEMPILEEAAQKAVNELAKASGKFLFDSPLKNPLGGCCGAGVAPEKFDIAADAEYHTGEAMGKPADKTFIEEVVTELMARRGCPNGTEGVEDAYEIEGNVSTKPSAQPCSCLRKGDR